MMIRRDFRDRSGGGATKISRLIFAMSRLSRTRVAISRLSGPKSSSATFATKVDTSRLKKQRRDRPGKRDQKWHFQVFRDVVEAAQFSRSEWRRRAFPDQSGDGATFQTKAETVRLRNNSSRPWWMWRDVSNQSGDGPDPGAYGATFQTKAETARLSRPRRRWRDQATIPRDRCGHGAIFQFSLESTETVEWCPFSAFSVEQCPI